jgi:beta-mannosidase
VVAITGWSFASTTPGAVAGASELCDAQLEWRAAIVPGTVAQSLRAAGAWGFDSHLNFDDADWWYRASFDSAANDDARLVCHGLATIAEVWLNGERVLNAANMFERYAVDVSRWMRSENELAICFRSLADALSKRRPRPRWKTKLVANQQLRWFRTTLLGRMPGWSPPVAPVGPWRPVELDRGVDLDLRNVRVTADLQGSTGVVRCAWRVATRGEALIAGAVRIANITEPISVQRTGDGYTLSAELRLEDPELWWPHTHGTPRVYAVDADVSVDGRHYAVPCCSVGFRGVRVETDNGDFRVDVNGVPVFCRGACWTVNDIVSMSGTADEYRRTLALMRDAGANMIRVGGTMVYEADAFYDLCDELGILVWQDFMFANMDYPADDASFADSVRREAAQQIERLARHPCIAVYCGNSEVEQQAAMLGVARDIWRNTLFADLLPGLCAELHPGSLYVPSTPTGGDLPFHAGRGISHYYGVGAYMRPVADARRANVRFTPECLGFANVPEPAAVDEIMSGDTAAIHDPRWKARTPRDTGAGWDFEDVRDHYLRAQFGVDPVRLRAADPQRYLAFGRATTGEVMSQVFSEWRRPGSSCHGGLVWFLRDLWAGAGWGILDSHGEPKACFHYLRREWQPQAVLLTDEGLDGVHVHVLNERTRELAGSIELTLLREGRIVAARGASQVSVPARGSVTIGSDTLLDGFYDVAYTYRFGPPKHSVTVVTLRDAAGTVLSEAFHFPTCAEPERAVGATVSARAIEHANGSWTLSVESSLFLYAVRLDVPGFDASDNYFHLMPGRARQVTLTPARSAATRQADFPAGFVEALNLDDVVRIEIAT